MEISEFLDLTSHLPVWDVRSPAEHLRGHIPGAINVALFTDKERARIGTLYKQVSQREAFKTGLQLVGPKMRDFIEKAEETAPNGKLLVHCWRGGQRSGAMAWLLRMAGYEVETLTGGYKSYRKFILNSFSSQDLAFRILGGPTGSGKTAVLHALRAKGEQVIDLEALANHKGSSFGRLGQSPQPTTEQFENDLYKQLRKLDPSKIIWLENESRGIGQVFIPDGIWEKMQSAPLIIIDLSREDRLRRLVKEYANLGDDALKEAFRRIKKRIGGLRLTQALQYIDQGKYAKAASEALDYYDRSYHHHRERSDQIILDSISSRKFDAESIANEILRRNYAASQQKL